MECSNYLIILPKLFTCFESISYSSYTAVVLYFPTYSLLFKVSGNLCDGDNLMLICSKETLAKLFLSKHAVLKI